MKKKTIVMAGASGLIGTYLSAYLKEYNLVKINRTDFNMSDKEFAEKYRDCDVVINLSGAPVIRRWTRKNRKEILDSRILTTRKLGCILKYDQDRERQYLSASAIGIYDEKNIHTEDSTNWGKGFLTEVVKKWEAEALHLESFTPTVCILRIGIVLSPEGGMLDRLLPMFRLGLGAWIGSGEQFFSWIHINDLARAMVFIISNNKGGIFNMISPAYCTNIQFTKALALKFHKPARFMIPKIIFTLLYGKSAAVVTGGQAVIPERLVKAGFKFNYQNISEALGDIVN